MIRRVQLKRISKKRRAILSEEAIIEKLLLGKCEGRCMLCGKFPDYKDGYGKLHLSHIIPKSRGGKSTLENCELICRVCHNKRHGIIEK